MVGMSTMQFERERKYALEKINILIQKPQKNVATIRRLLKELLEQLPTVKGISPAWQDAQKKFIEEQQKRLTAQLLQEEEEQLVMSQLQTLKEAVESAITSRELTEYRATAREVISKLPGSAAQQKEALDNITEIINEKENSLKGSQPERKRRVSATEAEQKERQAPQLPEGIQRDIFFAIKREFDTAHRQGDVPAMEKALSQLYENDFSAAIVEDEGQRMYGEITAYRAKIQQEVKGGESAQEMAKRQYEEGLLKEFKEEFEKSKQAKDLPNMQRMKDNLAHYTMHTPSVKEKHKQLLINMQKEIDTLSATQSRETKERESKGEEETISASPRFQTTEKRAAAQQQ
jgi:molybdopterin biosynthesis enzyme MoaB